jgi:hypothetical protein
VTTLTLFTAPKPFAAAHIATIQANALASWSRLKDVDVILMGEGQGLASAAQDCGALQLPAVRTNAHGTPLISSMIELARQYGRGDLLGLINADMIAMSDLVDAAMIANSRLSQYVLLGRRWDLDLEETLDFSSGWERRLRNRVHEHGTLHKPAGSDFFVFPRELYTDVPDFAVGRAGWDNWMIFAARRWQIPVVDCTESVMVVHQNHDYAHLPGGVPHYALPETDENIRLAGGSRAIRYTMLDATHRLSEGRLLRPLISGARLTRGIELLLRRIFFFLPSDAIESIARPKRWRRRWERFTGVSRRSRRAPTDEKAAPIGDTDE